MYFVLFRLFARIRRKGFEQKTRWRTKDKKMDESKKISTRKTSGNFVFLKLARSRERFGLRAEITNNTILAWAVGNN